MSKAYPCVYCTDDLKCTKYTDDEATSFCVLGPCKYQIPSFGDKIRTMSDEELAEWICQGECPSDHGWPELAYEYCSDTDCYECWLQCLKKEANE